MDKRMTPVEIVLADAKKNPQGLTPTESLKLFSVIIRQPNVKVYHKGNTLMFTEEEQDGRVFFHFLNAARLEDFVKNGEAIFEQVQLEGKYKEIYSEFTSPKILKALEMQSFPYEVTKEQRDGDPEPEYVVVVRL